MPVLLGAMALMLIAAHPSSGTSLYGASRWIDLGPLTVQPSELAKLGLVAVTAAVVTNKWSRRDEPLQLLFPLGFIVGLVAMLGLAQRDLGTTLILCGLVLVILFAAGVRLRYLAIAGGAGLAAAMVLIVGEAYRRTRFFDAWLNPWADARGNGYQLIQGLIAEMKALTHKVNGVLKPLFTAAGIDLVDYKLEFGHYADDATGPLVLGDEFTPDGCRLWDAKSGEKLDKDRFRRDLGSVIEHYREVARRIGAPL